MPTPQSIELRRKSNASVLSYLQGFYPTITAVTLNLDGSILVESSDTLEPGTTEDLLEIMSSPEMWEAEIL